VLQRGHDLPDFPRAQPGFWNSLRHAWNGLLHTVLHQRNMKVHVVSAVMVGLVGSGIPLGLAEKVTLIFCVLFIFFAEILNSALEALVDLHTDAYDERARVTKDAAAAGVLVLAAGTVVIFAAILVHNLETIRTHVPQILRQLALGIPLTVGAAMLLRQTERRRTADIGWFAAALALWGATLPSTQSYVFSAMTFGLLGLCFAAALRRRSQNATGPGSAR
jgi:diacylglycerol kinase (ATP)